jgi:hypothetical protein
MPPSAGIFAKLLSLDGGLATLCVVLLAAVVYLWKHTQSLNKLIGKIQAGRVEDAKAAALAQIALAERLRATTDGLSVAIRALHDLLVMSIGHKTNRK